MEANQQFRWIGLQIGKEGDIQSSKNKFIKSDEASSVKSIFQDELSDFDGGNTRILCVYATENNNPFENARVTGTEVDVEMPVGALYGMGMRFIYVYMKEFDNAKAEASTSKSKSAFDVLMTMSKTYDQLPPPRYFCVVTVA